MPKVRLLAATAVLLLAAGCSSASSAPTPTVSAVSPGPAEPVAACPDGAYIVTALEGRGEASAIGKGTGGDIGADFSSGTFTISSDGSEPVTLHIGPSKAEMRFHGQIKGSYQGQPSAMRLTTTDTRGDVTVEGAGFTRSWSASGLGDQLIGKGVTAQVRCDEAAGTAVVTLPNAALTLTRQG